MKNIIRLTGMLAAICMIATFAAVPASAQATRTWVSGVGDDANPCSRTAPCKTFAGAISKTATNGEINCLDPGGFGSVTITKSIAIVCQFTEGGITNPSTNGIVINAAGAVVYLSGLDIEGIATGVNGINFISGAALHVDNSTIRANGAASPGGNGINFVPSATADLVVTNSTLATNGQAGGGNGIFVAPTGTSNTTFMLNNVKLINNSGNGLKVDSTGLTSGVVSGTVLNSLLEGNIGGLTVLSNTLPTTVQIDSSAVSNNSTVGIYTSGSGTNAFIGRSVLSGNGTAFVVGSGRINTYGDNSVGGNITSAGTPSTPVLPRN